VQLVEGHQVGVAQIGQAAELVLESGEMDRGQLAQRLERDAGAALAVEGLVDLAHAALAEQAEQAEPPLRSERPGLHVGHHACSDHGTPAHACQARLARECTNP
jgi:hypothetical protein